MQHLSLNQTASGFSIIYCGKEILSHGQDKPCLAIGSGNPHIKMNHGNFLITDHLEQKVNLTAAAIKEGADAITIDLSRGDDFGATMRIFEDASGRLRLQVKVNKPSSNRLYLRLNADPTEHVYGLGEQFSYFDVRGREFPLWTSEQGVGRNKKTQVTFMADCNDDAGGDYYWTFFPQPTFVSSRKYYCHSADSCYACFDFAHPTYHELAFWQDSCDLTLETAPSFISLLEKLTALLGRQPELPDWIYDGLILGIQGGPEICERKVQTMQKAGVPIVGIWAQDWSGIRMTSFGKRVMWNWRYSEELYPQLPAKIKKWQDEGIYFLTYVNPYLASDRELCQEAAQKGYLAKTPSGEDYLVDFGEFYGGVVDFTNPQAFAWFKQLLQDNLLKIGIKGWMADFGEYLPTDALLASGESALMAHNRWPAMWAQCNYEALQESHALGDAFYFMRAGFTGSGKYSTMMWAGDQNVDWSMDDGLASVIPAALSAGMSGHGLHHSDIGGYTTLYGMKRSKELLLRWCDFSTFTLLMRTHEGNRPQDNWQFDSDGETMAHFARMVKIHVALKPYLKALVKENANLGIPVMRPLFMHYEQDERCYQESYQYLLGADLLVAPVYRQGCDTWEVYLPQDKWVHLWSGREYTGGRTRVSAPLGQIPVFYRKDSPYAALFAGLKEINA